MKVSVLLCALILAVCLCEVLGRHDRGGGVRSKRVHHRTNALAKGWFRRTVSRAGNIARTVVRRVANGARTAINAARRVNLPDIPTAKRRALTESVSTAMSRNQKEQPGTPNYKAQTYYDTLDKHLKYQKTVQKTTRQATQSAVNDPCRGQPLTFEKSMVNLTSPNYPDAYPDDAVCSWKVVADNPDEKIQLLLKDFEVEAEPGCEWDVLKIYDGPDDSYPLIDYYCGESVRSERAPRRVESTGPDLTLVLYTDSSVTKRGFVVEPIFIGPSESVTWPVPAPPPTCGRTDLVGEVSGTIKTPNYPNDYPEDDLCEWRIKVPSGHATLTFDSFELEDCGCQCDSVKVFTNLNDSMPLLTLCGGDLPDSVISSSEDGEMKVVFRSDYSENFGGFEASFTSTAVFTSYLPTMTGLGECGGIFTNQNGLVHSPAYEIGGHYPNGKECEWIILTDNSPDNYIVLDVLDLDLERCGENCGCDRVLVYDGVNAATPVHVLCGNMSTVPQEIVAKREMKIIFQSDGSISGRGFDVRWRFDSTGPADSNPIICGGELTLDSGKIESPEFNNTGNYGNYTMCEWRILPQTSGQEIVLHFPSFDVEGCWNCSCDRVEVFDGLDSTIAEDVVCGDTVPSPIPLSGSGIVVRFKTDYSITRNGFVAEWLPYDSTCGRTIDVSQRPTAERSTEIKTPGFDRRIPYTDGADCTWEIHTGGSFTRIAIVELSIEECGPTCVCDRLEVYDTPNTLIPEHVYCGENRTDIQDMVVEGGYLKVHFHSDYSLSGRGFKAVVSADGGPATSHDHELCRHTEDSRVGTLRSQPFHESSYEDNTECVWVIKPNMALGEHIHFKFDTFAVEKCSGRECSCDRVEIFEHPNDTVPCAKYCGSMENVPHVIVPKNDSMKIRFVTDGSRTYMGFTASWEVKIGPANDTCPESPRCGSQHSAEENSFIASPGYNKSSPYAGYYPDDMDCEYEINIHPGQRLRLTIEHFGLEDCDNCGCDFLQIIKKADLVNVDNAGNGNGNSGVNSVGIGNGNGNGITTVPMNGNATQRFCRAGAFGQLPHDLFFDSSVVIKFASDYSIGADGFKITYGVVTP